MPLALLLALLALLLPGAPARAQPAPPQPSASCPGVFEADRPPVLLNPRLAARTHPLCYGFFAVLESGVTRTPLWSAEHLSAASVASARDLPRDDMFHPEETLPPADRAELSDYVRSGFDRGHMSPSGDMPDPRAQADSFSLANMVPQAPQLNRMTWERIESAVRDLAVRDGQVFVVTGPLFRGRNLQSIGSGVLVPTAVFKAVYDPAAGTAGAYVCLNRDPTRCRVVSIANLAQYAGLDPFPGLPAPVKATAAALPRPRARRGYPHR